MQKQRRRLPHTTARVVRGRPHARSNSPTEQICMGPQQAHLSTRDMEDVGGVVCGRWTALFRLDVSDVADRPDCAVRQQFRGGLVGPVQVIENQHQPPGHGNDLHQGAAYLPARKP